MNYEPTRQRFRELVTSDEPPFTLSSTTVRRQGRAARARRRSALFGAGIAVVAASVFGVVGWTNPPASEETVQADSTAGFSAEDFPAEIKASVQGALGDGPSFTEVRVAAYDAQDNEISPPNRGKASAWRGVFSWSPDHAVHVYLGHNKSESEGNAASRCTSLAEAGFVESCAATSESDGLLIRTTRPAQKGAGGFLLVGPGKQARLGEELFFLREVEAQRSGDLIVSALEVVRASSFADAAKQWRLSEADLESIATDEGLTFPEPPAGKNGCRWIVPERDELRCNVSAESMP